MYRVHVKGGRACVYRDKEKVAEIEFYDEGFKRMVLSLLRSFPILGVEVREE